jgi:hypothetical protein
MTAEDVLVGIFYHFKKQHKERLTADRAILHNAFFNASQQFPKVMSLFCFRQRELFPESKQLDQALSNLDATGLISRQNLTPRYYYLENSLDTSYEKFSKNILAIAGIQEKDINIVADKISTEISTHTQG